VKLINNFNLLDGKKLSIPIDKSHTLDYQEEKEILNDEIPYRQAVGSISDFSKTIDELENVIQEEKDKTSLQTTSGTHTKIIIILSTVLGIIVIYNLFKIYVNKRRYFNHRIVVPRVELLK